MVKHLFKLRWMVSRTLTLAAFALVALALSIAICMPATALANDKGNLEARSFSTATLTRLAGNDADETAAAISKAGFASSECAVLARMDDFADALGASGFAGALDCPILLTSTDGLTSAAAAELTRLGVKTVYIIGGTGAISNQLEKDLEAIGITNHDRVYGDYAWDTSLKCAAGIEKLNGGEQSDVIVAMSSNFQDALSISTFAYKYHVPLILETNTAKLAEEAVAFIDDTTGTIYVPGGPGAVPTPSVEEVFTVRTIQRLYGEDGYDTSNQIATYMTEKGLLSASTVAIASGAQNAHGVDALAGAALIGQQGGVMLLANGNEAMEEENYTTIDAGKDSKGNASFLTANKGAVFDTYVLGGEVVAPSAFFDKVEQILSDATPDKQALPTSGWALSSDVYTYDGTAQTPKVSAPNNLQEGIDYSVTYANNTNVGTATATITGIGTYTGTITLTFTIKEDTTKTGGYWLATANAENPESASVVLKTQDQIDEDMNVLHGTLAKTTSGKDKDAVSAEYTNYMNGKSADGSKTQEVRLYTKWHGTDAGYGANQWVEFRIIQVGAHDSDGSAVTFMATHSLPTAKQMNSTATNTGGWTGSEMYTTVFGGGSNTEGYVATGLSDLKDAVKDVTKKSTARSSGSWTETTSSDAFWLVSHTEVFGNYTNNGNTLVPTYYSATEGSQYAWFTSQSVNAKDGWKTINNSIATIAKTRSGSDPASSNFSSWWLRSPYVNYVYYYFGSVYSGSPSFSGADYHLGVIPAFAM